MPRNCLIIVFNDVNWGLEIFSFILTKYMYLKKTDLDVSVQNYCDDNLVPF